MSTRAAIARVKKIITVKELAEKLGVTRQAINFWEINGRMPDTEYSCRTNYAEQMEALTGVSVKSILGHVPACIEIKKGKVK